MYTIIRGILVFLVGALVFNYLNETLGGLVLGVGGIWVVYRFFVDI